MHDPVNKFFDDVQELLIHLSKVPTWRLTIAFIFLGDAVNNAIKKLAKGGK